MRRKAGGLLGRPTILIVEDNPLNMELTAGLLETAGYKTIGAWDAESGVRLAREKQPHLILMDVALPGLDGISAARILKEDPATLDIPIIALTANAIREDEELAYEAGCDAFMTKPINIRNFPKEISVFLGHRLSRAGAG